MRHPRRIAKISGLTEEDYSNAHLIAAAPELLEACEGMLGWARRVKEINPGPEIMKARNAITKAEGGQIT